MAAVPPPESFPTVDDVAAVMRARTKDNAGRELGTFTENTRPTAEAISLLIANSASEVAAELSSDVPTPLWGSFSTATKFLTAYTAELSYWPEQIDSDRSAAEYYWQRYLRQIDTLAQRLAEAAGDGEDGLRAAGIGVLGLKRPEPERVSLLGLGSPPGYPELANAVVNYDDPWD